MNARAAWGMAVIANLKERPGELFPFTGETVTLVVDDRSVVVSDGIRWNSGAGCVELHCTEADGVPCDTYRTFDGVDGRDIDWVLDAIEFER